MNTWRRWLFLIGFWLGSLVCGTSQSFTLPISEDAFGQPPADGLADHAGVGHRNAAMVAKLKEDIHQLRENHGFQLYILLESVLVSGDAQLLASRLRRSWIPEGDGMVLVFEMDTRSLGIGQSFEQEADPMKASPGQVPSYETNLIVEKAKMNIDTTSSESMLESFTSTLVDGYNEYYLRKNQPVSGDRSVKTGLIIVGGAAALALLGLMAALLVRRSDSRGGGRCFYFPEVQATERLGAPFGGGEVSSRRFGTGERS